MTKRQTGHSVVDTRSRRPIVLTALAVGALFCACSDSSGTGVLKGTASPCVGVATFRTSHAWKIKVVLRRGSTVVSTRTVLDTEAAGDPVIHQIFSFTEPPGSYSISGPTPEEQPVVIKPGTTSTVALADNCK